MINSVKQSGITTDAAVNALAISVQGKSQLINYFDGLSRPIQSVITKGSSSQKDVISPKEYDQYGREVKKYLSYSDQNSVLYGSFKDRWNIDQSIFYNGSLPNVDVDNMPYSNTILESSPLKRVLAQGSPGAAWQSNLSNPYDQFSHVSQFQYLINKADDNVRIFNVDSVGNITSPGYYGPGMLTVKISIDEQQQTIKEFDDMLGHIIVKRVMVMGDSLQTYYLYDHLDLLRGVIQPEGTTTLQTANWVFPATFKKYWMFLYRYDDRGRMVMKKVPGADSVLIFYDQWDRVVLIQDSVLRASNNFIFTKYDALNRSVITGQINDTRSTDVIRSSVMSSSGRFETVTASATEGYSLTGSFPSSASYALTIYTITHYDSYTNLPTWSSGYSFVNEYGIGIQASYLTGQIVATQTRVLGTAIFLRTVNYFDDRYRIIQIISDNYVGGKDRVSKVISFDGKVTSDYHSHTSRFFTVPNVTQQNYSYDHFNRLLTTTHKTGAQEVVTINQLAYNELGQLLNKKIHQSASHPSPLQKLDYYYNIRGWLNGVNRPQTTESGYEESDLFSFELHYNTRIMPSAIVQYNGNISETTWKGGYDETFQGYNFIYDQANRMNASIYGFQYSDQYGPKWSLAKRYNEADISYDHNGNIKGFTRYFGDWNEIDYMTYGNYKGNQLGSVGDMAPANLAVGFQDKNNGSYDYYYDANGNLISDYNKDITSITYNYLNLPNVITITNKGTISYIYDAAGNKLQKTISQTLAPTKITNYFYAGDYVYRSGVGATTDTLEFISHPEGRLRPIRIDTAQAISMTNLKFIYDYYLKDHLGNIRDVLTTEQQTDFYAATMETSASTKENALFSNINSTDTAKPSGFTNDSNNKMVSKLNGDISVSGNKRIGPSIILKVMTGDTISISTWGWYKGVVQPAVTGLPAITSELLPLLSAGVSSLGGGKSGAILPSTSDPLLGIDISTIISLDSTSYVSTRPKAFLNWMVVGEDFNAAKSSPNHIGTIQLPACSAGDTTKQMVGPANMVIRRNGWIYVYLSNESNQSVYFDNLVVNLKHGPLIEQKNYYTFGMENPALSTKAIKYNYSENRYKFNGGNELQNKEFSDGSGLELYDAVHRMYDPQLGRFGQIDELAEIALSASTYSFGSNNPILRNDPFGLRDTVVNGELQSVSDPYAAVTVTAKHTTQALINTYNSLGEKNIYRVKDKGVRDWLINYDNGQKWLHKLHLEQREQEEEWLEYGMWLIPGGEVGELFASKGIIKGALKLLAIKHGKAVIISGAADLTVQMVNGRGSITQRLQQINVASTLSSMILEHPLASSAAGGMLNISYNTLNYGGISQLSDPNLSKSILLNSTISLGGEGYFKETSFGIAAGQVDQFTNLENK